jgi:hypothetical protein
VEYSHGKVRVSVAVIVAVDQYGTNKEITFTSHLTHREAHLSVPPNY